MERFFRRSSSLPVLFFTILGFLTMGYHPGAEDDAVYLAAVKARVTPSLYPHDAAFFRLQMRTSVFDSWMAGLVHATGLSVASVELLVQFLSILSMVYSCWLIVSELFEDRAARWGAIAMFSAMLTLPVAGTALYIADQYLHPRNPATALILLGIACILAGKRRHAVPLLVVAFLIHPLMGAFGVSFCFVLTLTCSEPVRRQIRSWATRVSPQLADAPLAALVPFGWLFDKPSPTFVQALQSRRNYFLYRWTWYEWLGAVGPLLILLFIVRAARRQGRDKLERFATAFLIYGVFHLVLSMVLTAPDRLVSFTTLEPMRYLQLVYVFLTLFGGAYLGQYVLGSRMLRWAMFLLLANLGMFAAQRRLFASTAHLELPNHPSANQWVQAFDWIRQDTPTDAYFAIGPEYMTASGEDAHSFRALAERSALADNAKDPAVVTKALELAPAWKAQVEAQTGWSSFQLGDFERLKSQFGVDWVLVTNPPPEGLECPWHNGSLAACRIP